MIDITGAVPDVRLHSSEFRLLRIDPTTELGVTTQLQVATVPEVVPDVVFFTVRCAGAAYRADGDRPFDPVDATEDSMLYTFDVSFLVGFPSDRFASATPAEMEHFGGSTASFLAWPYLRQHIQDCATRSGVAAVVLPAIGRAGLPADANLHNAGDTDKTESRSRE